MLTFTTSNDTSWIPLETPGDLLETSRDVRGREYEEMIILYKYTVLHSPNFREFQLLVLWEHVFEAWKGHVTE